METKGTYIQTNIQQFCFNLSNKQKIDTKAEMFENNSNVMSTPILYKKCHAESD